MKFMSAHRENCHELDVHVHTVDEQSKLDASNEQIGSVLFASAQLITLIPNRSISFIAFEGNRKVIFN